jgi:hypothetical protein
MYFNPRKDRVKITVVNHHDIFMTLVPQLIHRRVTHD